MSDGILGSATSGECLVVASQDKAQQGHEEEMLREVLRAIRSIKYGSVQLVIQDGRVVQIEKTEKVRFHREPT